VRQHLETFMSNETLLAWLTSIFGTLAVLLAAIGLYGVISCNVARRTSEIGIRIVLGAKGAGVQWMVLRESLGLLAPGLGLGLPLALYAVRLVRSQLYELSPFGSRHFLRGYRWDRTGYSGLGFISRPSRRRVGSDDGVEMRISFAYYRALLVPCL
jgi:ABC-type antimicrobial peptide transport system permease subunit